MKQYKVLILPIFGWNDCLERLIAQSPEPDRAILEAILIK
jgi:hypothetical protein